MGLPALTWPLESICIQLCVDLYSSVQVRACESAVAFRDRAMCLETLRARPRAVEGY
jgi:hypothetical protein